MMQRAREFSDIRSQGAPAFHLRATFSFVGEGLETIQGTFTEAWVSNSQWRRETLANGFQRVEVGGAGRFWLVDKGKDFPVQATRVSGLVEIFPSPPHKFEFESIRGRDAQDNSTECAISRATGRQEVRSAFCFDKRSGALVEEISPEPLRNRAADNACRYGSFQNLGIIRFRAKSTVFWMATGSCKSILSNSLPSRRLTRHSSRHLPEPSNWADARSSQNLQKQRSRPTHAFPWAPETVVG